MKNIMAKLKGSLRSMTIWFNGIMTSVLLGLPMAQDSLPQLQQYIPNDVYRYLMAVIIVANILLRFKTNSSLESKNAPPKDPA